MDVLPPVGTDAPLLWDRELAALDFETTGLDADTDRVIEVAVVRGRAGATPRRWTTLVDPCRPVDATEIHGITDEMVRGQPRFDAIATALVDELEGAIVVAHNARFDLAFLRMELRRLGRPMPELDVLDSLGLARRVLPIPSHSLASICEHLGLSRENAHRALDDAAATWELAWRLFGQVDPGRALTVREAERLCRRATLQELRVVIDALQDAARRGAPILIDYRRADAQAVRREITVRKVSGARVEAWCHLRGAERVFRVDRIRVVGPD